MAIFSFPNIMYYYEVIGLLFLYSNFTNFHFISLSMSFKPITRCNSLLSQAMRYVTKFIFPREIPLVLR